MPTPILTPDVLFFFDGQPGALALYEALAKWLLWNTRKPKSG